MGIVVLGLPANAKISIGDRKTRSQRKGLAPTSKRRRSVRFREPSLDGQKANVGGEIVLALASCSHPVETDARRITRGKEFFVDGAVYEPVVIEWPQVGECDWFPGPLPDDDMEMGKFFDLDLVQDIPYNNGFLVDLSGRFPADEVEVLCI